MNLDAILNNIRTSQVPVTELRVTDIPIEIANNKYLKASDLTQRQAEQKH